MAQLCRNRYNGQLYRCSSWSNWGRWVLLGVIIFVFIAFFFICSCITARRRRKAGRKPMYGTGWAATGPAPAYQPNYPQQTSNQYNQGWNNGTNPEYNSNSNAGYYGGQNQSYFGGQQGNTYAPPAGPPPGK